MSGEKLIGIFTATEAVSFTPQIYCIGVTDMNLHFLNGLSGEIRKIPWDEIQEVRIKGKVLTLQTVVICLKNGAMEKYRANTSGKLHVLDSGIIEYLRSRSTGPQDLGIKRKQIRYKIFSAVIFGVLIFLAALFIALRKRALGY